MSVRAISIIRSNSSSITIGETPAVGSSSISTSGRVISARPTATCWRCPPDNSPAGWCRLSFRIGKRSNTCPIVSATSSRRIKAPISRFSSTVIEGNTFCVCGTNPIPLRTRSCGLRAVISSPFIMTCPPRKASIPNIAFMAVDLPAPFGPTTTAISPRSTPTVQLCRISTLP